MSIGAITEYKWTGCVHRNHQALYETSKTIKTGGYNRGFFDIF